jgi:hypothetical protein
LCCFFLIISNFIPESILVLAVLFESELQQGMEQLEKRMDAAEQQIKELREDLNRRFDQLVEMIRKGVPLAANEGDSSKEDVQRRSGKLGARPPQHAVQCASRRPIYVEASEGEEYDDALEETAYQRVLNPTYARDTYKVKAEIPSSNGNVDIEGCLDWLCELETFFEVMEVQEDRRVPLVAYKLKGGAGGTAFKKS